MDLPRRNVLTWVQGSLSTDAAEGCGIYLLTILALGSHFLLLFLFIFPYVHVLRFSRLGVYPKLYYITHSLYRLIIIIIISCKTAPKYHKFAPKYQADSGSGVTATLVINPRLIKLLPGLINCEVQKILH